MIPLAIVSYFITITFAFNQNDRTRNRAQMLMLNAQGRNVSEIAQIFNCHEHTVRASIQRWEEKGLAGLWSARAPRQKISLEENSAKQSSKAKPTTEKD